MPLSAEDRQRIVALTSRAKKRGAQGEDDKLNLAGADATPLPVGYYRAPRRDYLRDLARRFGRLALYIALPLALVLASGAYIYRYDLYRLNFSEVFDSTQGPSFVGRLREQIRAQKHKRQLLDDAKALGFAGRHMAAVANIQQVLALEPTNSEALTMRATALQREVVSGRGALRRGEVDTAIASAKAVLGQEPQHPGAQQLLDECAQDLVDRGQAAFDRGEYLEAGEFIRKAESIAPGFAPAQAWHDRLVMLYVRRADERYLAQDYVAALDYIEMVRLLEANNARAQALFEKIDERVGFPEITINSVLAVGDEPRVIATIHGKTAMHSLGDVIGNVRVTQIDPRTGAVRFQQIYTSEEQEFIKTKGSHGQWISP